MNTSDWTKLDDVDVWIKEDCGDEKVLAIAKVEIETGDPEYTYAIINTEGKALGFFRTLEDALNVDHVCYEECYNPYGDEK